MNYHNSIKSFSVNISVAGWAVFFSFFSVDKQWIKTGRFSKWPSFSEFPLEIPAQAAPLVTAQGALENKGLAVESCLDGEGCRRCCEQSRMSRIKGVLSFLSAQQRRLAGGRD